MIKITLLCPTHPAYDAKIRPGNGCKMCRLLFSVRNETHKVISVPFEERTDAAELIIHEVG
jgi:hypothetical protein